MASSSVQFDESTIGKETKKLIIRFVAILVAAPLLGWMLSRAWQPDHAIYATVADTMANVLQVGRAHALQMFTMGALGLYFGFLTIFVLDIKKRVQGALLLLGTVIGLVVLTLQGRLLAVIDFGYLPNLLALVVCYAVGLAFDVDRLLSISLERSSLRDPRTEAGEIPEFRNAARGLFAILALVLVVSLVQTVLAGTFVLVDVAATAVGIYLLYSFIQYEVESDYMLLGPGKSGKSMAMLGMALTIYDFDDVQPDPNPYLQRAIERTGDPQYGDDWPFEQTEGLQETSFQLLVGDMFPRRMRLVAFDYPGQLLPEIAERVRELAGTSLLDDLPFVGGSDAGRAGLETDGGAVTDTGDVVTTVASNVVEADTLMIVIDCERLVNPRSFEGGNPSSGDRDRSLGIEYYKPILQNVDVERTIIVATKADVLVHDDSLQVDPPDHAGGFERFKRQVNAVLDDRYDVTELKQQLGQSEVQPVFYETRKVDGEYVPLRDDANNLIPVGYGQLIDVVREAP